MPLNICAAKKSNHDSMERKENMRKIVLIIAVIVCFRVSVRSESVKWLISPEYEKITYYSSDIFKCEKEGHLVLIDWNGNPLIDQNVLIDSITEYTEGFALALRQENNGYRIVGLLAEEQDHQFQFVDGDYYMTTFSFFSEGCLVVSNKKGKMGYLDNTGKCVINCDFTNARPFKKGFASVNRKKNEVLYINRQGKTKNPIGFHGGIIDKGSSFNDSGEAIVRHDKECAIINNEMQVLSKRPYEGVFPIRTYDYAYSEDYVNPTPNINSKPIPDNRYGTFERMAKKGYCNESGKIVVPAQFNEAGSICNGRAIAAVGNHYGILELIDGDFASVCLVDDGKLVVYPGMKCRNLEYDLLIPTALDKSTLKLMLDKGDGQFAETVFPVSFQPVIENQSCVIKAMLLSSDGLLLWEEKKELETTLVQVSVSSPSVVTPYAMENGIQQIKASITNHSDVELEVSPVFTISLDRSKKNAIQSGTTLATCRLAPGQKKELIINVRVKENEVANAKVSVTVDGFECDSSTSKLQLQKI